jgi:transposase
VSKERRNWTSEEKIKLLRRHLIEKVPISTICDEAHLAPSAFHRWQEQLFFNAALALEGNRRPERGPERQRIEKLEQKARQKDEVLAELMAEHISLKKELGEL